MDRVLLPAPCSSLSETDESGGGGGEVEGVSDKKLVIRAELGTWELAVPFVLHIHKAIDGQELGWVR